MAKAEFHFIINSAINGGVILTLLLRTQVLMFAHTPISCLNDLIINSLKSLFIIFFILISTNFSFSQEREPEPAAIAEEQLEIQAETEDSETEDDWYVQQLEVYKKHPLNLNNADASDLKQFLFLTPIQVENFIRYRKLLGNLITIYELQAIPGWDIGTIKKLLPFIVISNDLSIHESLTKRLRHGEQTIQFKSSVTPEKTSGFENDSSLGHYQGSGFALLLRYKYSYKNLLQYGITADKDAGEQFFKGVQKHGFDFYSFHFFVKKIRSIKSLAIGDFTVNLGQGLIQWQGPGFKKSASVLEIKRQGEILRPYNSAGEFNFHRGMGITMQKNNWEVSGFVSAKKFSANVKVDSLQNTGEYISSLLTSGYHRTLSELQDRNRVWAVTYGGNITYKPAGWNVELNTVHYEFSKPFQRSAEPYDLFALTGKRWSNYSVDYSYTIQNVHVYGEFAMDKNLNTALLNGIIASIDPTINVAVVYRRINKAYQSLFSNAFTENTFPTNENGLYTSVSIRPAQDWRLDVFADVFEFPWLKFRLDAPGSGKNFLLQLTYTPNKAVEIYSRYRNDSKQSNLTNTNFPTHHIELTARQNWRIHLSLKLNRNIHLQNRLEIVWYNKNRTGHENGFLTYTDFSIKPSSKPFSGNLRLQYFETDGFNSRLYVYERDVLFSHSIPALLGKGLRWYVNLNADFKALNTSTFHVQLWLRFAQTIHINKKNGGNDSNEISGLGRSQIKFQILLSR